ncbi:hypothetical protein evm_003573 [Chilo suppressalis]|nr:hypothetical protein evm_003573 [Chilo suppressalis]
MVGLTKSKFQQCPVYFGHPFQFWRERKRLEMEPTIDIEEMKKCVDVVEYDNTHLQKLIVNRTEEKVRAKLEEEEMRL